MHPIHTLFLLLALFWGSFAAAEPMSGSRPRNR
jgi:hypothetical protein